MVNDYTERNVYRISQMFLKLLSQMQPSTFTKPPEQQQRGEQELRQERDTEIAVTVNDWKTD